MIFVVARALVEKLTIVPDAMLLWRYNSQADNPREPVLANAAMALGKMIKRIYVPLVRLKMIAPPN